MGFRRPVTVWRTDAGVVDDNGRYQPGGKTRITIQASVQPLGSQERYTLAGPEGSRNAMYVKLYSDTPLKPRTDAEGDFQAFEADTVEWQGRKFEVIQSDLFQNGVISHYRAYAVEVRADDG